MEQFYTILIKYIHKNYIYRNFDDIDIFFAPDTIELSVCELDDALHDLIDNLELFAENLPRLKKQQQTLIQIA